MEKIQLRAIRCPDYRTDIPRSREIPLWWLIAEDDEGARYLLAYIARADGEWNGDPRFLPGNNTADWEHPDAVYKWDAEKGDFDDGVPEKRPDRYELAMDHDAQDKPYGWPKLTHVQYGKHEFPSDES